MDLCRPMAMACECLLNWPDPEHDFMVTGGYGIAHDLGRWWDALLRYEEATGYAIPGHLEVAMLRNMRILADNPDGLIFVPPGLDWTPTRFEVHSLREGLLAFTGLIKHRNSTWAAEAADKMLKTVKRILRPDGTIDTSKLDYMQYASDMDRENVTQCTLDGTDYTTVTGRFIEALVWHYEATADPLALELAHVFAAYHLEHSVNRDGTRREEVFSDKNWGHSHSYLGTLRGLLLYGFLTRQQVVIDTVTATHRDAVRHMVTESGHVSHDLGMALALDALGNPVAESASAGDAAQIALWLAQRDNQTDMFDYTERNLRARILPAQIQDSDARGNKNMPVYAQHLGGWGGCEYPYSSKGSCKPDYVAAVLHTLVDVYNSIVTYSDAATRINLHFNYEDENLRSVCERGDRARLSVHTKSRGNLLIRVPCWAPREGIALSVNGREIPLTMMGEYAFISREIALGESNIVLEHDLPKRTTTEETYTGQTYRFAWKGDEIVGISPNPGPRPFYPNL